MKGIIDRFEGNYAVVELDDRKMINIDIKQLPEGIKEGDVINIEQTITIDKIETEKLKKEIEELTKDLWKN